MIPGSDTPGRFAIGQISAVGSSDGNASGQILTVNATLLEGVATGGAIAQGDVIGVLIELIDGVAFGQINAVALGAVLDIDLSLLDGLASGSANASGELQVVEVSLIDGTATGGVANDGNADGVTLTVNASLIAGTASGVIAQVSQRHGGPAFTSRPHPKGVDAIAFGAVLIVQAKLSPGIATAISVIEPKPIANDNVVVPVNALAPSAIMSVRVSVIEGKASGGGSALGDTIEVTDWTNYDNDFLMVA